MVGQDNQFIPFKKNSKQSTNVVSKHTHTHTNALPHAISTSYVAVLYLGQCDPWICELTRMRKSKV